jgi:hypothetical protein
MAACTAALAFGNFLEGRVELGVEQADAAYQMLDDTTADADLPPHEADVLRFYVTSAYGQRLSGSGDQAGAVAVLVRQIEETTDPVFRAVALENRALVANLQGLHEDGLRYAAEAERLASSVGDVTLTARAGHHRAVTFRLLGRLPESEREFRAVLPDVLATRDPSMEASFGEDYAALLSDSGRASDAALLFGAAAAMRERIGLPMLDEQEDEVGPALEGARAALGDRWNARFAAGRDMTVEQALTTVMAEPVATGAGIP